MDKSVNKNNENKANETDEVNILKGNEMLDKEDVLYNQGSEEQKMKEKYLSEVSKIEDAPGNGGERSSEPGKEV